MRRRRPAPQLLEAVPEVYSNRIVGAGCCDHLSRLSSRASIVGIATHPHPTGSAVRRKIDGTTPMGGGALLFCGNVLRLRFSAEALEVIH